LTTTANQSRFQYWYRTWYLIEAASVGNYNIFLYNTLEGCWSPVSAWCRCSVHLLLQWRRWWGHRHRDRRRLVICGL